MDFKPPEKLVLDILRRNGLEAPDGRPLYAYKSTTTELEELGRSLKDVLRFRTLDAKKEGPGFCLFFAERFRTDHRGGRWKWDTVLKEISPPRRGGPKFYDPVERGLRWWGRDLHWTGTHRLFLVTLVCEGGLPLHLLKHEGSRLRTFFQRLLHDVEEHPNWDHEVIARELSGLLPETLVNEDILAYSVRLIEPIVDLRQQVKGEADPIEALNQQIPDWKSKIPLRMSDSNAEELLKGLVKAKAPDRGPKNEFHVEVALTGTPPSRVLRKIRCPGSIESRTLFGSEMPRDLPTRIMLFAVDGNNQRGRIGTAMLKSRCGNIEQDEAIYQITSQSPNCSMDGRIDLLLTFSEGEIRRTIPGGDPMDDSPWMFRDTDSPILVATGSVRVRGESALVAVTDEMIVSGDSIEKISEIPFHERALYRFTSDIRIDTPDDHYGVRLGKDLSESEKYHLVGPTDDFGIKGTNAWLGLPKLKLLDDDGFKKEIPPEQLQRRSKEDRGGGWRPWGTRCLGLGDLRRRDPESRETVFRTRLSILPESFSCETHIGKTSGRGEIRLRGVIDADVDIPNGVSLEVEKHRDGEVVSLHCCIVEGSDRPEDLKLKLELEGGVSYPLTIPFPAECMEFITPDGVRHIKGAETYVGKLLGTRALALSPDRNRKYHLEAKGRYRREFLGELKRGADGHHTLALDQYVPRIEQLLAQLGDEIDFVQLYLVRGGSDGGETKIKIRHYGCELVLRDRSPEKIQIEFRDATTEKEFEQRGLESANVSLLGVENPMGDAITSLDQDLETDDAFLVEGPGYSDAFLAIAELDGPYICPPMFEPDISTDEVSEDDEVSSLKMLLSSSSSTSGEFKQHFRIMNRKLDHQDWSILEEYMELTEKVPANFLPVFEHLKKDMTCMAMIAINYFRKSWFKSFWDSVSESGFLWEMPTLLDWGYASERYMENYKKAIELTALDPLELYLKELEALKEAIRPRMPAIGPITDFLAFKASPGVKREWDFDDLTKSAMLVPESRYLMERLEAAQESLVRTKSHLAPSQWPRFHPSKKPSIDEFIAPRLGGAFTEDVLDAPAILANWALFHPGESPPLELIHRFEDMRIFDTDWFGEMHARTLALVVAKYVPGLGNQFDQDPDPQLA